MTQLSEFTKNLVREEYEKGASKASMSRKFGVSTTTITKYARKGEWLRPEDQPVAGDLPAPSEPVVDLEAPGAAASAAMLDETVPDLPITSGVADPDELAADIDVENMPSGMELSEALAEIERLDEQNRELLEQISDLRPTADVETYTTPEEVVQVLGEDLLMQTAKMKLRLQNRRDALRGLASPIDFDDPRFETMVTDQMHVEVQSRLAERTSHISPMKHLRVVKMRRPKPGPDGRYSIVQIAMEEQVNNMKGEQSAPMAKAMAKGFKLVEPYGCQRIDCWNDAVRDPLTKKLALDGYCSPEHRADDPYLGGAPVPGVTTTSMRGLNDWVA